MSQKSDRMKRRQDGRLSKRIRPDGTAVLLVIMVGILFLALGLVRGEPYQVWLRAVQICLGCIGIG